jgi:hypothetical protein
MVSVEHLDSFGGRDVFPPVEREGADDSAWGGTRALSDGTTEQALEFPGLTTLSTFAITADKALDLFLGAPASNAAKTVSAGGIVFFTNLALAVADGIHVSFNSGNNDTCLVRYFAAGE